MMRAIEAVIFDLDGVLVDSQPSALQAAMDTLAAYGVHVSEDDLRKVFGGGSEALMRHYLTPVLPPDQLELGISDAVKSKNDLQVTYNHRVTLLPGVKELLAGLKADDLRIALATMSARDVVEAVLDFHKIRDYFDFLTTADDVSKGKPNPEILRRTLARLQTVVAQTLYVGDSRHDLEPARALGLPFILADTGIFIRGEARDELREEAVRREYPVVGLENLIDIREIAKQYQLKRAN